MAASFASTSDVESGGPRGSPTSPLQPPPPPPPPPSSPSLPQPSESTPAPASPPASSSAAPSPRRPVDYSRRVDSAGKDVLTCCRLDHLLFDWLYFDRFRPNVDGDPQLLQEAAYNLVKLLSLHFFCEEFAVYPTVLHEAPNGRALVQELVKDHFLLRGALHRLDELMTAQDDGFCSYVCWMCDRHVQHADREEKEVSSGSQRVTAAVLSHGLADAVCCAACPALSQVLSWLEANKTPSELLELGRWYNIARKIAPTRSDCRLQSAAQRASLQGQDVAQMLLVCLFLLTARIWSCLISCQWMRPSGSSQPNRTHRRTGQSGISPAGRSPSPSPTRC